MKKSIIAVLLLSSLLTLTGCGAKNINVDELASKLAEEGQFAEELTEVSETVTNKRLALGEDEAAECAAYAGTAAVTDEVIVVKAKDIAKVEDAVDKYIQNRTETYTSYRPDEVPKLKDAVIETIGNCVIVCVSEDSALARKIIDEYTK